MEKVDMNHKGFFFVCLICVCLVALKKHFRSLVFFGGTKHRDLLSV